MVLLISYDLLRPERPSSYAKLKDYIEKHADSSIKPLYSQWLIETSHSPESWLKALRDNNVIDDNDFVLICPLKRPLDARITTEHWAWVNARV